MRILTFDPEKLLPPFFKKSGLTEIFSLECEYETDLESFAQKSASFDALFIFEKEHFEEAVELIKQLKTHQKPLVFFVTKHRTASSFQKLKQQYHVEYVLETPLIKEEMAALFRALKGERVAADTGGLPQELVETYNKSIFEKISRIEEQISTIRKNPQDRKKLVALRNEVHKIAGSAASYGYKEASKGCKAQEIFLYNYYSKETISAEDQEKIDKQNYIFLRRLRLQFQHLSIAVASITPVKSAKEELAPAKEEDSLVVVSSDLSLVSVFQKLAERFRLPLLIESNPRDFMKRIEEKPFKARGLVTEEYFPFTTVSGIAILKKLKEKQSDLKTGIISNSDDLTKRIEWLEQNINWVLKKPLTEHNVLQIFQQLEKSHLCPNTRAVVVDDDEDVGLIEKKLLEDLGIESIFLSDERNLLKLLEEFSPNLLLLDINLPHFNGKQLLETLRADMRFQRMIIVLVTAFKEKIEEVAAYEKNCDSIIYKPIQPEYFKSRVSNLLMRHASVGLQTMIDPTTSLYKKSYFLQKVHDRFPFAKDGRGILVLIEIDLWDTVQHTLSSTESKELLINVASTIKAQFSVRSQYGYMGESCFSLFFEGMSGGELEALLDAFFSQMREKVWLAGREDLRFTLSAGATLFDTHGAKLEQVLEETRNALQESQDAGGKRVTLKRLTEGMAIAAETRHVILVDDDIDLCNVITYMFKNHGFDIIDFHTGQEALDHFAKMERLEEHTLFILDRVLPDRDGITLLHMLKEKFPGRVKALFLTSLASEKDILDGLKMGAVDYITKPFSISVLVQKALAILNQ
ncbi:MAG: response regulator [Chlamydiales bacterium]|nr:response regulator [Chlamydiales bacterium]